MSKKLLIVDDEEFFLESLAEGLSEFKDIFTTDICFSVDEAIKKYKKTQYDLIISDIRMPKKGGLSLLMYLRKHNYKGNFVAMTAYGSEEIFKKSKELGGFDIIMKPFDFDWFRNKIIDFFSEKEGVSGTLDSIDLTSLLQMINLEKKSLTVKIKINKKQGFLYLKKGEIIHAEFDNLEGEQAALFLISINKGHFSLMETIKKPKQTINIPFAVLLLNIMKKIDENTKSQKEKCKEDKIFLKKDNTKKKEEKMLDEKKLEVLGDVGGFLGSAVYSADGMLLISYQKESKVDMPKISGLATQLFQTTKKISEGMEIGVPETIILRTDSSIFIHRCIVTGVSGIGVLLDFNGNVGLAEHVTKQLKKEFLPEFE